MPYLLRRGLASNEKNEVLVDVGMAIAKDWKSKPNWTRLIATKNKYLPICHSARQSFKIPKNDVADRAQLTGAFSDKNFQQGVKQASEYLHGKNLYNMCRAGGILRYRWQVARLTNHKPPQRADPILEGWVDPAESGVLQIILAPEMDYQKQPRAANPDLLLTPNGARFYKFANWIVRVNGAPSNTTRSQVNNCAPNSNAYIYQYLLQLEEYAFVARLEKNIVSPSMRALIQELKACPHYISKRCEAARTQMILTLKGPLEKRCSKSKKSNSFKWAEEENGFESQLLRVAICGDCGAPSLQMTGTNLSLRDFKLLLMPEEERQNHLPIYKCSQCGIRGPHFLKIVLSPEGIIVACKGADKRRSKNLHTLFRDLPASFVLDNSARFRQRIALFAEYYKTSTGKPNGQHAFLIKKDHMGRFLRVCDGNPHVDSVPINHRLDDETEIDMVVYTRDHRSKKEIAKEEREAQAAREAAEEDDEDEDDEDEDDEDEDDENEDDENEDDEDDL